MDYKLGKKPPVIDPRTLKLADYVKPVHLPTPPASITLAEPGDYGMMGNDVHGDCTCAALGHMTQIWTKLRTGQQLTPTDEEVLALYAKVNGGQDDGADMLTVLKTFHGQGFIEDNESAYAFVGVSPKSHSHVKLAVMLFGGVYLGVALPDSAQEQVGKIWEVGSAAGSWGGHAINIVNYDAKGLDVITWGKLQRMTWGFLNMYADEAFAVVSETFVQHPTPGFDIATLQSDLQRIRS